MKTILCYGDSNTFGADPDVRSHRFDYDVRWTGCLQQALGSDYRVIEEGMGGRTTVLEDPIEPSRNGRVYLPSCLESHKPLDLVVIMLGTNDLKVRFGVPASDIALGVGQLVQIIRRAECGRGAEPGFAEGAPEILIISPAPVGEEITSGRFGSMFGEASIQKSRDLAPCLQALAADLGCHFLDAGAFCTTGGDNLHLNPASHAALGKAVAEAARRILG